MDNLRTIRVVLGCDCDPDRLVFGGVSLQEQSRPMVWKGLEQGVPDLIHRLEELPFSVPVTWNIRCDDQVEQCHGDPAWSIQQHDSIWQRAKKRDDELAWHNHAFRYKNSKGWYQEIKDDVWIAENYQRWGEAFTAKTGAPALTSHGGWFFQNAATLTALEKAGVLADYSALPGRSQQGFASVEGSDFVNHYDWAPTPRLPYRPSLADYRVPAGKGEPSMKIVVAPTYTFRSKSATAFQWLSYALRKSDRARTEKNPIRPWSVITVSNTPLLFGGLIAHAVAERPPVLFLYFHPDELLPKKPSIKTRIFSTENLVNNLRLLVQGMTRAGLRTKFVTAAEALAPWTGDCRQ